MRRSISALVRTCIYVIYEYILVTFYTLYTLLNMHMKLNNTIRIPYLIGVHSAVLSTEGTVEHIDWPRNNTAADTKYDLDDEEDHNSDHPILDPATAEIIKNNPDLYYTGTRPKDSDAYIYDKVPAWADIVTSLDPDRDVLLFPCDNAVDAKAFDWNYNHSQSSSSTAAPTTTHDSNSNSDATSSSDIGNRNMSTSKVRKRRLVVVEATWQHGKVVANRINKYRKAHSLPPIPCVKLSNITGSYWRFQDQGHSAVSSIEAIAHTAVEAGSNIDVYNTLLTLFRLQKYRVLSSIQNGGKVPKVR